MAFSRYDPNSATTTLPNGTVLDAGYQQYQPKKDKINDFFPGFTVGGPLFRNHIFFFAAFNPEFRNVERKVNFTGTVLPFSQNTQTYYTNARVDAAITQIESHYYNPITVNISFDDPTVSGQITLGSNVGENVTSNYVISYHMLDLEKVVAALVARPERLHVICTGRNAHPKLVEAADLVTEMREVKHPYTKGILAQRGIDY